MPAVCEGYNPDMGNLVLKDQIEAHLSRLIALPLTITRRAADLRIFHFGTVRPYKKGHVGEYALHIQCPWRIDGPAGIITGRADLFYDPNGKYFTEEWDYSGDSIQDIQLDRLLGTKDPISRLFTDQDKQLVVERVEGTILGDAAVFFSKGYRLAMFPSGIKSEAWRLFKPGNEEEHFVIDEESLREQSGQPNQGNAA